MPIVEQDETLGFTSLVAPPAEKKPAPAFGETWGAAFRLENDVVAAYKMVTENNDFTPDPLFSPMKKMRDWDTANRTNLWDNYRDNFIGVRSEPEFLHILGKITQEQRDKETLEASGLSGVIASITAGTLSPTMLLPFIGEARGLTAVGKGAALVGTGAALQELPLQMQQETRTAGDSAFNIAAATVIGGVLGGAVSVLRPGELDKLVKQLDEEAGMAPNPGLTPIPGSVGAAAVGVEYAGKLKSSYAAKSVDWLGPVTRVINQESNKVASWFMSQLSDAGVRMERNAKGINTSEGGTVESLIKPYYGEFANITETLDGSYSKYFFGENAVPGFFPNTRATLGGFFDNTKLSKAEFREEVSRALRNRDESAIPEVTAVAKAIRARIFDPILGEAQRVGILGEIKETADPSYFYRMYRHDVIASQQTAFVDLLTKEFAKKLNTDFGEKLARLSEVERRDALLIEDLVRPKEEVDALRTQLAAQSQKLEVERGFDLAIGEEQIRVLRKQARDITKANPEMDSRSALALQKEQLLSQAKKIEESLGDALTQTREQRGEIKRRRAGLARAAVALEERQFKKLELIETIEDQNGRALDSVARAGKRVLNKLDDFSDKELNAEVRKLNDSFSDIAAKYDRGEERIAKLLEKEQPDTQRLLATDDMQQARANKLSDLTDEMERFDNLDRVALRQIILEKLQAAEERALKSISRRVLREQKLMEAAAKLDPAEAARRVEKLRGNSKMRRVEFQERFRAMSDGTVNISTGGKTANSPVAEGHVRLYHGGADQTATGDARWFTTHRAKAEGYSSDGTVGYVDLPYNHPAINHFNVDEFTNIKKGITAEVNLPGNIADTRKILRKTTNETDLTGTADFTTYARERATEVKDKILATNARIPLNDIIQGARGPELARVLDIDSNLLEPFLENDVEKVLRSYLRTMAPDIEMQRKFGSVNGSPVFDQMLTEYNEKVAALGEKAAADKWEPKKLAEATKKLEADYKENKRDLEAVISRLRGTWGLPDNPDGMAYRMGRVVLNLNVLRLMGGTLIASIPDAARPIQRYGLTRTFRDGFVPLVTNLKQIKMSARELRLAGGALDAIMHTRSQSLHDVMDDFGRHSKFERGLDYATNNMGAVALFDYWTVAMKQFSSSIIIGKLSDSLDIVHGGAKATKKEIAEAQEFLASKGLAGDLGRRAHAQLVSPEGGTRVNNVLMPNTESWVDADATRAFRGALVSETNHTIITPGVERPLWMDSSMGWKLIAQFKSFGMSSTHKVLLSGMQQRDMAFMNGSIAALALGALSYYIASASAGGEQYEKMLKAGPGKFADEAINRSGILGIFSDAQRFAERIPATQPYVSFSGDRTSRRGGDDIVSTALGPSFGLLTLGAKAASGIDDPSKATAHAFRQMLPWQNLIFFRWALDNIEKNSNLPERRN